jgi:hypothetical protein
MQANPKLEKRTASRTKMVLPLRSSSTNAPAGSSTVVHTLNLSPFGAKLGAFRQCLQRGDILLVQRRHKRAKCKVVWSQEVGPREIQVGIEFLEAEDGFWGVPLEDSRAGVWIVKSDCVAF